MSINRSWTWSDPTVVTISSRATLLAAAKRRQAILVEEWARTRQEMLTHLEQALTAAHIPDNEQQAEQVRASAPLGHLLQPHTGLGQSRRSPRTVLSSEEQHAQLHARLVRVGQQLEQAASVSPSNTEE
jgi:hypothetical protein